MVTSKMNLFNLTKIHILLFLAGMNLLILQLQLTNYSIIYVLKKLLSLFFSNEKMVGINFIIDILVEH